MSIYDRDYYRPSGFRGFSFFPPVIKTLLIANGVVFFLQIMLENITFGGIPGWYYLNRYFALNPLFGFDNAGVPFNFQVWQLVTYQFMHGDFGHIFFNMFMLWMFGMEIENLWGSKKFLFFYLLCGIIGGLFQLLLAPLFGSSLAPTIGASGAVYGVMVAFALFFPERYIFIYFLLPVKAKYLITFLIVLEFMMVGDMSFIAHLAHIGGAASSFVFVMLDRKFNFNIDKFFNVVKDGISSSKTGAKADRGSFRKPFAQRKDQIKEADFFDINNSREEEISQEVIDGILDKISREGYQNLSEREKKILFEVSKRS